MADSKHRVIFLWEASTASQRSVAVDERRRRPFPAGGTFRATDVLIGSSGPTIMGELGLDWEDERELNACLAYVSVTGFGRRGPLISTAPTVFGELFSA